MYTTSEVCVYLLQADFDYGVIWKNTNWAIMINSLISLCLNVIGLKFKVETPSSIEVLNGVHMF